MPESDPPFYVTGGSLHPAALSYIERQADSELYEALKQGEYCYILTARQTGKSSLRIRTALRLRAEGYGVVSLDLTALGQNLTPEQWYYGLLEGVGEQLGLEEALEAYWLQDARHSPLQRFMGALREVVLPGLTRRSLPSSGAETRMDQASSSPPALCSLIIFVDEIDMVRSLPFPTDEFFAAIRECYNRRAENPLFERLTFCLIGVAAPTDLIRDTRLTPFNIGHRIELEDFTENEAAPLAQGLTQDKQAGTKSNEEDLLPARHLYLDARRLLARVLYWTGGHPYLTQRLCRAVRDTALHNPASTLSLHDVDRLCADLFLSSRAQERDDNLIFVRERLLRSDADLTALLERYEKVWRGRRVAYDDTDAYSGLLHLSGVTQIEQGCLLVRNRIYAQVFDLAWIRAHLPNAELQRQKAAYRRGLVRAGVLATVIVAALGALTAAALNSESSAIKARHLADARAKDASTLASSLKKTNRDLETQRNRAVGAEKSERAQKKQAQQARNQAVHLQKLAEQKTEESRERLVRLNVANGMRLVEDGDLTGALPWFVEALRLDEGRKKQEAIHRIRIGATLAQCPRLLQVWFHAGQVNTAAFSPEGRRVVTASSDGSARVWELQTGQPVSPPLQHRGKVNSAVFSPDGRAVLTASEDRTARLWDACTGKSLLPPLQHSRAVLSAEFNPRGDRILTVCSQIGWPWRPDRGEPRSQILEKNMPRFRASFSPNGDQVVAAGGENDQSGEARLWDTASGKLIAPTFRNRPGKVAQVWSALIGQPLKSIPRYAYFVSQAILGSSENRIAIATGDTAETWNVETGEQNNGIFRDGTLGLILNMAFHPDGSRLVTAHERGAHIWDAKTGQGALPAFRHRGIVSRVIFSPDGRWVATASWDGTARVWDAETGEPLTPPLPHQGIVNDVAFSPDGNYLITASGDRTARLWALTHLKSFFPVWPHKTSLSHAVFSPDGRYVLSADFDGMVSIRETQTGRMVCPVIKHSDSVWHAAFSPDGRSVVTCSGYLHDHSALVWDLRTGRRITPPMVHQKAIRYVVFSPDSRSVLTASEDGTARVWSAATGQPLTPPLRHRVSMTIALFTPDGHHVVTASEDQTVRVWDATTGRPTSPPLPAGRSLSEAPFSPDGHRMVIAGTDGRVYFRELPTGRLIRISEHYSDAVVSVAFSPNGKRVVTASGNATQVWEADTGLPVGSPMLQNGELVKALFSPSGQFILTATRGGRARVWDADTGEPVTPFLKHSRPISNAAFSPDERSVITSSWDRTAIVWRLPRNDRSVKTLQQQCRLLSVRGAESPATGDTVALRTLWQSLRSACPEDFRLSREEVIKQGEYEVVRLLNQARRTLYRRPYKDVIALYSKAISLNPHHPDAWFFRGMCKADLQRWGEAAADFRAAKECGWLDTDFLYQCLAQAYLVQGDHRAYRQTCAEMLPHNNQEVRISSLARFVHICSMAPDAVRDYTPLLLMAERTLSHEPKDYHLRTYGAILYRAGKYEAASQRIRESMALQKGNGAVEWLFLAMAQFRLGQTVEARQWLEKAEKRVEELIKEYQQHPGTSSTGWYQLTELQVLLQEAKTLSRL